MGRARACSSGLTPVSPRPQHGNPDHATQRSGKRRHLRQPEAEKLSGGLLNRQAGSHQSPPPPGGERRPGSAFGSHSSRDCQQARRWCSSRPRPGACRAAPQRSARFPRRHAQNIFVCWCTPRHGTRGVPMAPPPGGGSPDPSSTITPGGCRGSARRRQRRRPAARGARRGLTRTTKTHHPTSPLRPPPRA